MVQGSVECVLYGQLLSAKSEVRAFFGVLSDSTMSVSPFEVVGVLTRRCCCLSVRLSVCPPVCLTACLSCLSVCLVCLSAFYVVDCLIGQGGGQRRRLRCFGEQDEEAAGGGQGAPGLRRGPHGSLGESARIAAADWRAECRV